jgi:hypothetical protein
MNNTDKREQEEQDIIEEMQEELTDIENSE